MDTQTLKNGIPKFAMDDVDIVLDELCSGYDKATECRMRKELFDHYQSAFDDAVGEGLGEEKAHEKVLEDLGWETALMVGEVCRDIGWFHKTVVHRAIYGKNIDFPQIRKLYLICVLLGTINFALALDRGDLIGIAANFLCTAAFSYSLYHSIYSRKNIVKKQLVAESNLKKRLLKPSYDMGIMFGGIIALSLLLILIFPDQRMFRFMAVFSFLFGGVIVLRMVGSVNFFIRRWKEFYPDNRIF